MTIKGNLSCLVLVCLFVRCAVQKKSQNEGTRAVDGRRLCFVYERVQVVIGTSFITPVQYQVHTCISLFLRHSSKFDVSIGMSEVTHVHFDR
jgi:hypothetical protein